MHRAVSVEDLVANLASGTLPMGRVDSEAAFQEWLKKIPSANNLGALANAGGAGMVGDVGRLDPPTTSGGTTPTTEPGMGIPRVPSLDILRQLVMSGNTLPPVPKQEPLTLPKSSGALGLLPPIEALPMASRGPPPPAVPPAATANAIGSAALTLGQTLRNITQERPERHAGRERSAPASSTDDGDFPLDTTGMSKDEIRKQRRMLSNRESARRSRKRKQEHLQTLEQELNEVKAERQSHVERIDMLERRAQALEDDNQRLREDNERLREELRLLGVTVPPAHPPPAAAHANGHHHTAGGGGHHPTAPKARKGRGSAAANGEGAAPATKRARASAARAVAAAVAAAAAQDDDDDYSPSDVSGAD